MISFDSEELKIRSQGMYFSSLKIGSKEPIKSQKYKHQGIGSQAITEEELRHESLSIFFSIFFENIS